ncbi:hypothetical protein L6259_03880 [Candidatus Parcubacteria bacterium]|nr:hypothetical protein [Patescibacteria group bacterium]MCG2694376.1 hypothetical protein [Candidatus Parcubacteria bacterium]
MGEPAIEQTFKSEKQKMEEERDYWHNTKWLVAAVGIAMGIVAICFLKVNFAWTLISAISSAGCLAGFLSIAKIDATLKKRLVWLVKLEKGQRVPLELKMLHEQLVSRKTFASHNAILYTASQHQVRMTESMFYKTMDNL